MLKLDSISPGERVLITGATGSLGQTLTGALVAQGAEVVAFSRDEAKQFMLSTKYAKVQYVLGDVRDLRACKAAVEGVDTVIHAASLKYVDRSELEPTEYALTNVLGTINVLQAVAEAKTVRRVVGISTDKACAPLNTYGATKLLLEKLFVEGARRGSTTSYIICRYGNVLATRGSVLLVWADARRNRTPIKVTDPTMTRFFFSLADAVKLIDQALASDLSGQVVSMAMPACDLGTLAQVMAQDRCTVELVGRRPGEKAHEDLLSVHEMPRVSWLDGSGRPRYFVYNPLASPRTDPLPAYTSDVARQLTGEELSKLVAPWL